MKNLLKIYKAVSDRNRLRILKILQHRSWRCVCEIGEVLGIGQPTTSRHLKILEDAGLVISRKDGKWVNYTLMKDSRDENVSGILSHLSCSIEDDSQVVEDRAKIDRIDRCVLCGCGE